MVMRIPLLYLILAGWLTFVFNGVLASAPNISYTPATNTYTVNTPITTLTPTNIGGAVSSGALTTFSTSPGGQPYGIAYDPTTGDIITSGYAPTNAIYRYSPSGVLLNTYTSLISSPKDMVVDNSGNIFVGNSGGNDVVEITPAGVTTAITTGFTAGTSQPDGMAIDNVGNIFVADQGTNKVYKIAPGATTATVYASGFTNAYGITVNSAGVVYVSQYTTTANIMQISTGGVVSVFVSKAAGGWTDLRNLDVDASDNLYVADYGNGSVDKITPAGVVSTVVTGLNQPRATAEDVFGNLYIANSGNSQIEELSPSNYSINIPLPAGMSFNTTNGQISGTPTVTSPTTVYTIVGHNGSGSGYTTVTITVDPTAPTGTPDFNCGPGIVNLSASGGLPAGGTYNWYAAAVGGASLNTGSTYTPNIATTTTYYLAYTQGGVSCAARVPVVGTISANPIISTAPTAGAYFSYSFTGGITTDISGANNGTLHGAPATTTDRYSTASNAYNFVAASAQYISTTTSYVSPGPQTFSLSVWFKTSTAGGYLAGFGNLQTGNSANIDRVIYIGTNGELYFGLQPGGVKKTINTLTAYNDGNWHHVVATFSTANGSNMYVDGALAASDPTMNAVFSTAGYWRVAYDVLTGYTNAPATFYFNGSLDDIAVANTELTPAQVNVLYGAGAGNFCAGNSLSLTANSVAGASYSWAGPGFVSALQNPTVPAAQAGTYVLTVTGAAGCTSTINVTAPSNAITYTWSGAAGTTNLLTAGNWDKLPLFSNTSNLVIPTGLAHYPLLTSNVNVYGLTIANGASFSLGGFTLGVGCNIINNTTTAGTGILYGNNNLSGITWNGSLAAQSYTGTNTTNTASLGSMTINNTAGGNLTINGGPVDIYNTLTMTNGDLTIGAAPAALTLKSTGTLTASVPAIPAGSTITGNVTVERYITGGAALKYRDYRFFSSPVYSSNQTLGASSGNVYDLTYLKTGNANNPVTTGTGGNANGFDKSGNPTIYVYREDRNAKNTVYTGGNYIGVTNITGAKLSYDNTNNTTTTGYLPVGNGFAFFFRGSYTNGATLTGRTTLPVTATYYPNSLTVSQVGSLNQGTVPVILWFNSTTANSYQSTLSYTAANTSGTKGFNLVGNPYASSIDWSIIWPLNPATINATVYEYDPAQVNVYGTYNAFTNISLNNGNKIIESGQGFFVQANTTGATLQFTEAGKSATQLTSGTTLLMGTPVSNSAYNQDLRLNISKDSTSKFEVLVGFNSSSNKNYNHLEDDVYFPAQSPGQSLWITSGDNVKVVSKWLSLPQKNQTDTVNVTATASTSGQYTITRSELKAIPQIYDIWLMDRLKKDSLDIRHNATYVFDVDLTDTTTFGGNRFKLIIRQNPALALHLLSFTAAEATNGAQINWKTENEQNYTNFTIERSTDNGKTFDVLGGFLSSAGGTYSFLDKNPVQAVTDQYRLKLEDLDGVISYSKIVPLVYSTLGSSLNNGISVYPNPTSGVVNLSITQNNGVSSSTSALQTLNLAPGLVNNKATGPQSYDIKIINISGTTVKSAKSSQASWQSNLSDLPPGTYIIQISNSNDNRLIGNSTFVKL